MEANCNVRARICLGTRLVVRLERNRREAMSIFHLPYFSSDVAWAKRMFELKRWARGGMLDWKRDYAGEIWP